ncbi:nitroreductase family protein [Lactonifactor longoviformis]|uniref:nitroreductase family protein n=1 Tax=Lactonifactor longoviformis TaxID=341220 RepID=UPI00210A7D90|nr:nitroreductase family protein [Lactonifactor longoviformis]MCQ4672032.1 nitroreductase family protein [Lactonifactor longoviformis]
MFKDLVKQNRSYRGYDPSRKITEEELLDLVDCARYTPASVNIQPLKYYLAYQADTVARIHPLVKWAAALPHLKLPHPGKEPAAYLVICQDTQIHESLTLFQKDVGITAQTILLAAAEKGLGGCMIGNFSPEKLSAALSLPESLIPMLVVALGKPDETVIITEVTDGNTKYYRDDNDVHYVPKRKLEDIVL